MDFTLRIPPYACSTVHVPKILSPYFERSSFCSFFHMGILLANASFKFCDQTYVHKHKNTAETQADPTCSEEKNLAVLCPKHFKVGTCGSKWLSSAPLSHTAQNAGARQKPSAIPSQTSPPPTLGFHIAGAHRPAAHPRRDAQSWEHLSSQVACES